MLVGDVPAVMEVGGVEGVGVAMVVVVVIVVVGAGVGVTIAVVVVVVVGVDAGGFRGGRGGGGRALVLCTFPSARIFSLRFFAWTSLHRILCSGQSLIWHTWSNS